MLGISAKEGIGIEDILEAIVHRMPAPKPTGVPSLQGLIFDSFFDTYKGVVILVRVTNGELKPGAQVKLLHSGKTVEVKEVGSFNPKPYTRDKLSVGETGYFTANIKSAAKKARQAEKHRQHNAAMRTRMRITERGRTRVEETHWDFRTYSPAELRALLRRVPALRLVACHDFLYDLESRRKLDLAYPDIVLVLRRAAG